MFPEFKFKWLAEETEKNLPVELDFINEANNIEKVAAMFKKHKFVKVSESFTLNYFFNTNFKEVVGSSKQTYFQVSK